MQGSPYYDIILQQGIEQGIEQGERGASIRNIIAVLTTRFPDAAIHRAASALESIGDLERLTELLTVAAST